MPSLTVTPKALAQVSAGIAVATIYTSPTTAGALGSVVRSITVCNTDVNPRTFTIHKVPVGNSPTAANRIYDSSAIAAKQTVVDDTPRVLNSGDYIAVLADAANVVTVTVDGAEVTTP